MVSRPILNAKVLAILGRVLLSVGFLALLGAWYTQITGSSLFGMSQTHLFGDATVLSLLGIGSLLSAQLHSQGI